MIIAGAKNPQQAAANATISELPPVRDQEHERLKVFYETEVAVYIRDPY